MSSEYHTKFGLDPKVWTTTTVCTVSVGPAGLGSLDWSRPWAPAKPNQIDRIHWRVCILAIGPIDCKDDIK